MEGRAQSPEGNSTGRPPQHLTPGSVQPVHKWPLRPGVQVHVNSLTSLTDDTKPLHNNNTVTTLQSLSSHAPLPPPHPASHHPYHQQPLPQQLANKHHSNKGSHLNFLSHHHHHTPHHHQYHPQHHPLQAHQQYPTLDTRRGGSSSLRNKLKNHSNSQTLPRQASSLDVPREDRAASSSSTSSSSLSHPYAPPPPLLTTNTNNSKYKPKTTDPDVDLHSGTSVVVQTRPDSSQGSTTGRKRKKPGQDPEGAKPPPTGPKDNGIPSPGDEDNKQTFYENLPFHGMQPPPNKDPPGSSSVGAGGSRPPSQLSQQASSGYGSTRSRKDDVNLNQCCTEEGSGTKDGGNQTLQEDGAGLNRVKRQNSQSYGSMRSTNEKPTKSALARTAAYFSMRLPGAKRKAKNKNTTEENHQMLQKQPTKGKAVGSQGGSSPGPSTSCTSPQKGDPQGESQQTTHFTSETKHTITSQPDSNTLTVESSQTSKLTVLSRPQSRAESNNNSIYSEGSAVSQSFPRPPSSNKVTHSEPSSDARTSDVTGDTLPVPAPRNNGGGGGGGGGRVRHTYQNIPLPTKDKSMGVQSPPPPPLQQQQQQQPPPQPYPIVSENRKTNNTTNSSNSYGTCQNPTPSSSSPSSSSPSSSSHYQYQQQQQQQLPPHYQRSQHHHPPLQPSSLYKQYPSSSSLKDTHYPSGAYNNTTPNNSSSYSSSTYPHRLENQQSHPPSNQSHSATSYPSSQSHTATSYPSSQGPPHPHHPHHAYPTNTQQQPQQQQPHNNKYIPGVVYADLKLPRNGQPNQYRRDLNTEYAILQFNGPIPFLTDLGGGDMEYADVDYSTYSYGPIPYKAASVSNAQEKKAEQDAEMKGVPVRPPRKK
ncbi:hypothetical protein Pmani_033500 [Petrolisthes manimaculis]|uniref:Uncharacterized protein n=1 Tax=Petrolisthes manimaculis TaxID=1843537 RepID=A0AAE1NQC6_9EUCA|nr:hypothetical protein Pmani_033500 [Petrolisthes manimaculis]